MNIRISVDKNLNLYMNKKLVVGDNVLNREESPILDEITNKYCDVCARRFAGTRINQNRLVVIKNKILGKAFFAISSTIFCLSRNICLVLW